MHGWCLFLEIPFEGFKKWFLEKRSNKKYCCYANVSQPLTLRAQCWTGAHNKHIQMYRKVFVAEGLSASLESWSAVG